MNTILTILLLIALFIAIVCDSVRLWTFKRTLSESKENVKRTICKAVDKAYRDWYYNEKGQHFNESFRENFDKYL